MAASDPASEASFSSSYARLPESFFARVAPTPVAAPRLLRLNEPLAEELGLSPRELEAVEGVETLAGNRRLAVSYTHLTLPTICSV